MSEYTRINSQEELDTLIKQCQENNDSLLECFVKLNFGIRSSKNISLNEDNDYYVYHECDDSEEIIKHNHLNKSFIGKALNHGALYKY